MPTVTLGDLRNVAQEQRELEGNKRDLERALVLLPKNNKKINMFQMLIYFSDNLLWFIQFAYKGVYRVHRRFDISIDRSNSHWYRATTAHDF